MKDVFISYSSQNKAIANQLCQALEERGINCWIAPRDIMPGVSWSESIIEGIEECPVMLLIFSEAANQSVQVSREIERAVHKGVTLLPLRIENIVPSKKFEYFLSSVHWLDAWEASLESLIPRITETVSTVLRSSGGEPRALPQKAAPEPARSEEVDPGLKSAGLDLVEVKEGEILFRQGDPGDSLYILESGRMSASVHLDASEERMLFALAPSSIIGEMSWLLGGTRTTTIGAVTDAKLWRIPHKKLQESLKDRERWAITLAMGIATSLAKRVDSMNKELLTQTTLVQKLQKELEPASAIELEDFCERLMGQWAA